jgi:hypothetical protein
MNKYSYITKSSCHPLATIKGFIKGELIRYSRLSSDVLYFNYTKNLFYSRLLKRGYSRNFLNSIFDSVKFVNPYTQLKSQKDIIPLVLPFTRHPNTNKVLQRLRHLKIGPTLPKHKLMIAYSKRKNISEILCSSSLSKSQINLLDPQRLLFPNKVYQDSAQKIPQNLNDSRTQNRLRDNHSLGLADNHSQADDSNSIIPHVSQSTAITASQKGTVKKPRTKTATIVDFVPPKTSAIGFFRNRQALGLAAPPTPTAQHKPRPTRSTRGQSRAVPPTKDGYKQTKITDFFSK